MDFKVDWAGAGKYVAVKVEEGGATIDTGLLDDQERLELAEKFEDVAEQLRGD